MLEFLIDNIYIKNREIPHYHFDKRDNFGFNIVNFPYLCSNIPTKPVYGVYIFHS